MTALRPGNRISVAVSGGADSVALLRALHAVSEEHGLVLRVVHVHHGLRGSEADDDAAFVRELAAALRLSFQQERVDTAARVEKLGQSTEQAARELRYAYFRRMLEADQADAVATGHTLDDQAETLLLKLMRGAWTEGLGGIFPQMALPGGVIVRPLLQIRRKQVEDYLIELQQPWREDSSNASPDFTRNRVRHELLPLLGSFNPNMAEQLSKVAELARAEEQHWQAETQRLLPSLVLPGKPVRGGGRSVGSAIHGASLSLDAALLTVLSMATQRRVLRAAALQLGFRLDFDSVARALALLHERGGKRGEIARGLEAERTARELRLFQAIAKPERSLDAVTCAVPGVTLAPQFGLKITATLPSGAFLPEAQTATLRVWRAGDRVRLRHTLSEHKVKEVLQRLGATPEDKACWPVLEWQRTIVWVKGCEVETATFSAEFFINPMPA